MIIIIKILLDVQFRGYLYVAVQYGGQILQRNGEKKTAAPPCQQKKPSERRTTLSVSQRCLGLPIYFFVQFGVIFALNNNKKNKNNNIIIIKTVIIVIRIIKNKTTDKNKSY